jgi:hypothetical protein
MAPSPRHRRHAGDAEILLWLILPRHYFLQKSLGTRHFAVNALRRLPPVALDFPLHSSFNRARIFIASWTE